MIRNVDPQAVINAVRARGNDARDLRDAAHEAHHALDGKAKKWDRESIHRSLMRKHRSRPDLVRSEVMARAVEQIVCSDLGVGAGGDVEQWATTACFEAISQGLPHTDPDTFARMVRGAMKSTEARRAADAVIALGVTS